MRLNPHYPEYYAAQMGVIHFDARRYEDAVRTLESLRTLDTPVWRANLAAGHAAPGHDDLAQPAVTHLLAAGPTATVARYTGPVLAPYRADREHLAQHLAQRRAAGIAASAALETPAGVAGAPIMRWTRANLSGARARA